MIQVLTLIGVAVANIGTTMTLFIWATNHAAEDRRAMDNRLNSALEGIRQEMKDFHTRLCLIEERRKND